jgi:hypothetical protein
MVGARSPFRKSEGCCWIAIRDAQFRLGHCATANWWYGLTFLLHFASFESGYSQVQACILRSPNVLVRTGVAGLLSQSF